MPTVALVGYVLIGLLAIFRREQFDGRAMSALSWFKLTYLLVMAGVVAVIVADAGGANLNMNYVIFPLLALMLIASVNLVVHLNRNKAAKAAPSGGGIRI
jgi:hypothetical protein